jgi:hypothetical protein
VTTPNVSAAPELSAMELTIIPAMPATQTAMTAARTALGDTRYRTNGLYLTRWGWSASAPSRLWRSAS